jgi:uncharacterized repeat protein (TIGR01451 family)
MGRPHGLGRFAGLMMVLAVLLLGAGRVQAQQSPPGCTGSGLGINLFTSSNDVHIGDTLTYSVTVFNGLAGTGRIVCDATGIVAGVVTPDGRTNLVTLVRTSLSNGQLDFYQNVASYVVRAQDIRPDGTVRATAFDDGNILQNDTPSRGGSDQGVNTEVSQPCIQLSALCFGGTGENGAITFTGSITNCGNNTLVGVTVTNAVNGGFFPVAFITNLARGQVATFSGSWIPSDPCNPSTAVLTARGVDQFTANPRTVTSSATLVCQNSLTPAIRVTKACPVSPVAPGQLLTFTGTVANTGNVTLTNIVVVNSQPAPNTTVFTRAFLAPGEVVSFSGSYAAPTNCSVSDTLTATASSLCTGTVTSTASATCDILTTPSLVVTAACPVAPILPGSQLTYSGSVRNSGNIALTNVLVVSDTPVANTTVFTIATLAPGVAVPFTGSYTVPAGSCSLTTTFTGTARDACTLNAATNTTSITCGVVTAPGMVVTLSCPAVTATVGGPVSFTGTVRNSGNVALSNVSVLDSQVGAVPVFTVATLVPGATASFTASFTAPADSCSVSSTVTGSGTDACSGLPVTATASTTCSLVTAPAILVTQSCPLVPATPGSLLAYTGTVRNSGNITLTNVVVLNSLGGTSPLLTLASLAPGAVASFNGSYIAPTNCSSTSTSTATARSVCGVDVSNSASSTCTILTAPALEVVADCPVAPTQPGGQIVYTGSVRNSGNITLTNVVVTSDRPGAGATVFAAATLVPGASAPFTGSFAVPAGFCSVTTTFTGIALDQCTLNAVTNVASITCAVVTAPALVVTVSCPDTNAVTGGPIIFGGNVRNTGNVTLLNVTVVNTQNGTNALLNIASLEPGASVNFLAGFTAPADSCSVSTTATATGNDSCSGLPVTASASVTCTLLTSPAILVTQACPELPATPGMPVFYTGTVQNPGNVTLTNVVVLNNQGGTTPVLTVASLAPGAVTNFSGSYPAPTNCSSTSTSTATGTSICGIAVASSASTTCTVLTTPSITVVQNCPVVPVVPGGLLTYTGTVRNSGDITLTNVVVRNSRSGTAPILTVASLAPGASATFTGTYRVPLDCCSVSSTASAAGADTCTGLVVSDTATTTCVVSSTPQASVTKVCPAQPAVPGELLRYSGVVANAGNITLVNVYVVNSRPAAGSPVAGPFTLAPGESVPYTGSYVYNADYCGTDTVTARATSICDVPVTASVTTTCAAAPTAPGIAVIVNCPLLPTPRGGTHTYTGTVINTGDVTLVDVFVVNSQPTNGTPVIGPITLAPGAPSPFTASFTAPVDCCEITETVVARGRDRCSTAVVTARMSIVCPLLTTPGLGISETCPSAPVSAGGIFGFTGSITNTGDVNLTNVVVYSIRPGTGRLAVFGPVELAPGESAQFGASHVASGTNTDLNLLEVTGQDTCQARTVIARSDCTGPLSLPPVPNLRSVTQTNGVVTIAWESRSGTTYTLQCKASVDEPIWVNIPGDVTATGDTASKTDILGPTPRRFYRVVIAQ